MIDVHIIIIINMYVITYTVYMTYKHVFVCSLFICVVYWVFFFLLKEKVKEEKQVEIQNRIREALQCGLKVLDDDFEQLEVQNHEAGTNTCICMYMHVCTYTYVLCCMN